MAESSGVSIMPSLRIPDEIHNALALKTADRYSIPFSQAYAWITDIERKGTQSIFFEQVKPVALDFFAPILSTVMPAIETIVSAAVAAGMIKARKINDEDYGTDIGPDGIPICGDDEESLNTRKLADNYSKVIARNEEILQHVDDPNGEKRWPRGWGE